MNIIRAIRDWRKQIQDPVKRCPVYRAVGCAHVDEMLCNVTTCDIVVSLDLAPNAAKEVKRRGGNQLDKKEVR